LLKEMQDKSPFRHKGKGGLDRKPDNRGQNSIVSDKDELGLPARLKAGQ
jgi:hypothetical protein